MIASLNKHQPIRHVPLAQSNEPLNAVPGAAFTCPQKFGQFEDPQQCDKYYECDDGVAKEKLCPDGLMFDPLNRKVNKCDQPFNVDCGDRIELRECPTGVHWATCPTKLHTRKNSRQFCIIFNMKQTCSAVF